MTWRPMTDVDAEILTATGKKLRGNDLVALCDPQGWMSDSLIDYGVTVCPAGEGGFPLGSLTRSVCWFQPALVTLGTGDARDFDSTLGGRGALGGFPAPLDKLGTLPKDASVLLFPVNRDNKHWSLLAFYKSDRTFVHYDSLTESNAEAAKKLIRRLFDKGYLSAELPMQISPQVKPQDDSYNCGMFVILLARMHLETGGKPDDASVARVDSEACDRFREVMLQSLGPLVADLNPQSMVADPGAVPKSEQFRAEERQRLQEAMPKVVAQLEKEESGPIELSGMKPCPVSESGTVQVTLVSNDPQRRQSFTSAKVIFTVGNEQFVRKAVRKGVEWVVEAQFQSLNAFDVDIQPVIEPAAGFDDAEQSATVQGVKAREHRQHIFTFTPKPDRKLYARFMVEAEKGPRPFPPGFRVDFVLDGGAEKVSGLVKEDGLCWGVEGHAGVNIPWRASRVGLAFPASDKWQKLTWKADSDLKTPASFEQVPAPDKDKHPAAREWFLLPPHSWELQRNEWDVPNQHLAPGGEFLRQIDLSQPGAMGSAEEPLVYVLKAGADPSKDFRMNGKVIDHVVVLMLENRGFDHLMGYLYEGATKPKNNYPKNPVGQHAKLRLFEGLDGVPLVCPYDFTYRRHYPYGGVEPKPRRLQGEVPLKRGARSSNTPKINPHEDFIHIFQDMYGKDVVPDPNAMAEPEKRNEAVKNPDGSYKKPEMNGWVQNYCDGILHHAGHETFLNHELISQIMDMYLPDQLPVMSGLARNYAVSDLWFCSVPSQTNTNRSFWLTGSAAGLVKNDFYPAHPVKAGILSPSEGLAADRLPEGGYDGMLHRRSLFDVLEENSVSWKYYWTLLWPPTIGAVWPKDLLPHFEADRFEANLPKIAQFEKDVAEQTLPAVSYLEPLWGGGKIWDTMSPKTRFVGNEFHPVQDVTVGEFFVKQIYDTLFGDRPGPDGKRVANNPKRDSTVLVITFDENGGTFDHLAPWKASPTKREPAVTQYGFKFDCYGVRVPTLLISKYVPPETIFRSPTEVPFDHASILATILKWRGIPERKWKLGDRVANAPTFDGVLEGDGSVEPERRKVATGMRGFDQERAKIAKGQPIQYGDLFSLKYVGDRWPFEPDPAGRPEPKLERQERLVLPDYLGGPDTWRNYYYPIGTRDSGKALKLRFVPVDKDGKPLKDPLEGPVKAGRPAVIEGVEGAAKGYTLAVPEVMGASCAYLYKGSRPSRWIPWLWNDRTEDEPLYYGDEVFLFSERYQPERIKTYYDPFQRLTIDPYQQGTPGLKRYARFRAGEWDMWKLEKAERISQEVTPVLSSERARAVLEGPQKQAAPMRVDLKLQFENPDAPKELQYFLTRSRPEVEVFLDPECKNALSFDAKNVAKLDKIASDLKAGKTVPAWARPRDDQSFWLVFSAFKEKPEAKGAPFAGPPARVEFGRAFTFLEGSSRWLQLVDSFQSTQEIKSSVNHIRSLAALADMSADEVANFAIKRLFIRKGILDQPVVIRIDGRPVALKHPLSQGKLPLRYSDFVVDRSGPKFLGALDAEVAVEALMYKDACISTTLAELKQKKKAKAFDANLIQSVRDMAERRLTRLQREKPQSYPELSESETEAATSVFELKHMAQRKLSDFDLTARETHTLSRAIALELTQLCGPDMPEPLVLEIGRIAWSKGGPIDPAKINKAWVAHGDDGAKAAAYYATLCTGPEYTPKKEYRHGKYKGKGYYHILIDEVGPEACKLLEDSMPDVDAGYGLGIPYMGPQVEERGGKFERESNPKAEEHDRFEIGDIITDETSHYGTVLSHDLNIQNALARLKRAGVKWSFDDVNDFKQDKNLRDNVRALLARSGKADIAKEYFDREAFIDAVLMFEQVAKKEAQAQLFKATKNTGKLMGNVSDVGQFLLGVDIASRVAEANGNQVLKRTMEALKEVVQLSCLIAFPRWSVFARNLASAKDTAAAITAKEFAKSINERSYAHHKVPLEEKDPDAPRLHVEWAGIDEEIAGQRLADYADGMKPVWTFLHQQKPHFEMMDALIRVLQEDERADGREARKAAARKAVREELARILPKLPNLCAQLDGREQALLDALTEQAQESAQFQVTRAPDEKP